MASPDLAISPDGNDLYASFPNVPVENSTKGALFVYDINAIESAINSTDPALLKRYAIDDLVNGSPGYNTAIDTFAAYAVDPNNDGPFPVMTVYDQDHAPIGLGGSPWGIAVQAGQGPPPTVRNGVDKGSGDGVNLQDTTEATYQGVSLDTGARHGDAHTCDLFLAGRRARSDTDL